MRVFEFTPPEVFPPAPPQLFLAVGFELFLIDAFANREFLGFAQTANGRLHVLYRDTITDNSWSAVSGAPGITSSQLRHAYSDDSGKTWTKNQISWPVKYTNGKVAVAADGSKVHAAFITRITTPRAQTTAIGVNATAPGSWPQGSSCQVQQTYIDSAGAESPASPVGPGIIFSALGSNALVGLPVASRDFGVTTIRLYVGASDPTHPLGFSTKDFANSLGGTSQSIDFPGFGGTATVPSTTIPTYPSELRHVKTLTDGITWETTFDSIDADVTGGRIGLGLDRGWGHDLYLESGGTAHFIWVFSGNSAQPPTAGNALMDILYRNTPAGALEKVVELTGVGPNISFEQPRVAADRPGGTGKVVALYRDKTGGFDITKYAIRAAGVFAAPAVLYSDTASKAAEDYRLHPSNGGQMGLFLGEAPAAGINVLIRTLDLNASTWGGWVRTLTSTVLNVNDPSSSRLDNGNLRLYLDSTTLSAAVFEHETETGKVTGFKTAAGIRLPTTQQLFASGGTGEAVQRYSATLLDIMGSSHPFFFGIFTMSNNLYLGRVKL